MYYTKYFYATNQSDERCLFIIEYTISVTTDICIEIMNVPISYFKLTVSL